MNLPSSSYSLRLDATSVIATVELGMHILWTYSPLRGCHLHHITPSQHYQSFKTTLYTIPIGKQMMLLSDIARQA